MTQLVKLWKVRETDNLDEIESTSLDFEKRLEDWLEQDISITGDTLLVISRQLTTDFGGIIDLLCIDPAGDLVILELKRDKTPRDITAQVLDYASWIVDLSHARISQIAHDYLNVDLEVAFKDRFDDELPETVNSDHRMIIVASKVDQSSERIITYLSENHGVSINAVTFQFFSIPNGPELMSRIFLLQPEDVEHRRVIRPGSKRRPNLTYEQLEVLADESGIAGLYRAAVDRLTPHFDTTRTTRSNISFVGKRENGMVAMLNLLPGESSAEKGLHYQAYTYRLADRFGVSVEELSAILPNNSYWQYTTKDVEDEWKGLHGFFKTESEITRFVDAC